MRLSRDVHLGRLEKWFKLLELWKNLRDCVGCKAWAGVKRNAVKMFLWIALWIKIGWPVDIQILSWIMKQIWRLKPPPPKMRCKPFKTSKIHGSKRLCRRQVHEHQDFQPYFEESIVYQRLLRGLPQRCDKNWSIARLDARTFALLRWYQQLERHPNLAQTWTRWRWNSSVIAVRVNPPNQMVIDKKVMTVNVCWLMIVSRSWQIVQNIVQGSYSQIGQWSCNTRSDTSSSPYILKWMSILPSLKSSKTPIICVYNKFDHCISRL